MSLIWGNAMNHVGRYRVCKVDGDWRIYDRSGCWLDTCESLEEAHTFGMQYAVFDDIIEPGGLTRLQTMLRLESAWRVDAEYRQKIAEQRFQQMGR